MSYYNDGIYRPLGQSLPSDHDLHNYVYNCALNTAVLRTYEVDPVMTHDKLVALLSEHDFLTRFMDSCQYFSRRHNREAQLWALDEFITEVRDNDRAHTLLLNNWLLFDAVVKSSIFGNIINFSPYANDISYITEMYVIGSNLHHYGIYWVE